MSKTKKNITSSTQIRPAGPNEFDRGYITGCDKNTEWQLPWFVGNFKEHMPNAKLSLADFGMTDEMMEWAHGTGDFHSIGQMKRDNLPSGWFLKPGAMLGTPYKEVCWLDTDCEVCGDLDDMWQYVENNKIAMVVDRPWTKRNVYGLEQDMHNSGVVAFRNKPHILRMWAEQIMLQPERGDQETLHKMLNPITMMAHITELPNKYNYLRIQFDDGDNVEDKRVVHWTGRKGDEHIRMMMKDVG